jgi:hypothetical protein
MGSPPPPQRLRPSPRPFYALQRSPARWPELAVHDCAGKITEPLAVLSSATRIFRRIVAFRTPIVQ